MIPRKRWEPLEARTVGKTPEAYGYHGLGDADGGLIDRDVGILRNGLKEALAYGGAKRARWGRAIPLDHAKRLVDEHDPA